MGKIILVVDDDAMNLRMAELILKKKGYDVKKADSGQEALALLQHETVDLILLDVEMPVMNGIETLDAIRSRRELAELPIVFLSSSEDMEQSVANGEYAEIETYLKDLSEKKVITTDACITVEDLNSCRELETWLSTCLKSKKLGEQAQESLYSLAETARIGRVDFYDELEIEIAKAECIVKARQEEKEIAENEKEGEEGKKPKKQKQIPVSVYIDINLKSNWADDEANAILASGIKIDTPYSGHSNRQ